MPIILKSVEFAYGRTVVLKDVNWAVDLGVSGLLGPNGSGKTTLLNLLVGLTRPRSGEIIYGSASPPDGPPNGRARIGYVPQRFSVAGEMTVLDTISYAAWTNGVPAKGCATAASKALATVQLDDHGRRRVRQLSGGQRQRMGIAAALAHEPDVVVLDEPTVGLDPGQRLRVREVIADIGRTKTVVLSTHLIEDIAHLCNHVGVLAQGRMAFDGTEDELSALIDDAQHEGVLGSDFERSYYALIERLGAANE
ncbi:ABC transporter ATP-binding protein [Micromonospora sp. NPDC047620]|uniref:ABC transporter ATP-binding protein n=1 Tax=Micromonospora sp. NPDC047620 TaxID=3364251 RepID=UPI003713AF46